MFHLFKTLRKKLLVRQKTLRYLKYAAGEFLLIVTGIFIALQLQNWNQQRQNEQLFKAYLEQVYNTANNQVSNAKNRYDRLNSQIDTVNHIWKNWASTDHSRLIYQLYFISIPPFKVDPELASLGKEIPYNPHNKAHQELVRYINEYATVEHLDFTIRENKVYKMINEAGIAVPPYSSIFYAMEQDPEYYTQQDFAKLEGLLESDSFIPAVRSLVFNFERQLWYNRTIISIGESLMKRIEHYDPMVRLLFKDVGIIGTSLNGFDNVGGRSMPMIEVDLENYIWETELYLKIGEVKFRCQDSWAQNWGGTSFPEGNALKDGPNIQVDKAGVYRILLNLSDGTYTFEYLREQ